MLCQHNLRDLYANNNKENRIKDQTFYFILCMCVLQVQIVINVKFSNYTVCQ